MIEKAMRKAHSTRVITVLSTIEKPKAPSAVKGRAGSRNQATCFHSIARQPIAARERLLIICAMVDTGTAISTP